MTNYVYGAERGEPRKHVQGTLYCKSSITETHYRVACDPTVSVCAKTCRTAVIILEMSSCCE
ncbi:hypothetical protein J6590_024203 [Homalodisca vitripennis]|nr:hypothetical protein J6590_024203 [Homalodisca vitripennis]